MVERCPRWGTPGEGGAYNVLAIIAANVSGTKPSLLGIFFFSTFLTSVWVWLFALSSGIIQLAARSGALLRTLQFVLPIKTKPLRSIGMVAFIPPMLVAIVLKFAF